MYKELAAITDKDMVTGFIVKNERAVTIMDIEEASKEAAAGNIDTLSYRNGYFIPELNIDPDASYSTKRKYRKQKKQFQDMTFADFLDLDTVFNEEDVKLAASEYGIQSNVILACLSMAFRYDTPVKKGAIMAVVNFWSPDPRVMMRLRAKLHSYGINPKTDYGLYFTADILLTEDTLGFSPLYVGPYEEFNILYDFRALSMFEKRFDFMMKSIPFPFKSIFKKMKLTANDIGGIKALLTKANVKTRQKLKADEERQNDTEGL